METNSTDITSAEDRINSFASQNSKEYRRMLLARKLKLKLKAENMKVGTLAEMLGKSPSEISKWLSGNHNFTLDTLFDIEDKLGVTLINIELPYKEVTNGKVEFEIPVNDQKIISTDTSFFQLIMHTQEAINYIPKS